MRMKEKIREIKEVIIEAEGLILAVIASILIILHHLGLLNYVASISTILILLSLLVIHETLKSLKEGDSIEEIKNTLKEIFEKNETYAAGFRHIYKQREDFIHRDLYNKIKFSKKFTAVVALCHTMLREVVLRERYSDLIVDKITNNRGYRFEFFFLKTDLYEKRAEIEESDPNILKSYRHTSFLNLLWIKSKIYYKTKNIKDIKRVKIYEYDIMPAVSEFLVDSVIFYGPYIARKCGDIPMVEIERVSNNNRTDTGQTLYDLFFYHYKRTKDISTPFKVDIERDFDSVLSEKMENGEYKIERIYNIITNETTRKEYYDQITKHQKTFEDILKDIELKNNLT